MNTTSDKPATPQERKELETWMKSLGFELVAPYGETRKTVFFNETLQLAFGASAAEFFYPLVLHARSDAIGEGCKALQAVADELELDLYGHDWMRLVSVVDNHIEQLKKEAK